MKVKIPYIIKHILCFIGFPLILLFLIGGLFLVEAPKLAYDFYDSVVVESIMDFKCGMKKKKMKGHEKRGENK